MVFRNFAVLRASRRCVDLVISPKTVGAHLEHVYAKLGVTNRAMASLFAAKHGLISVDDA
jgi:DNA-binding CsgD family transcriptional regulator